MRLQISKQKVSSISQTAFHAKVIVFTAEPLFFCIINANTAQTEGVYCINKPVPCKKCKLFTIQPYNDQVIYATAVPTHFKSEVA